MRRCFVGLVVVASALAFVLPAQAVAPNVHVTPRTGLIDGQNVLVSGAGWVPHWNIWIFECSAGVWTGDANSCTGPQITGLNGSTPHRFAVHYLIKSGAIGDGFCGLGAGTGTQRSCAIKVVQLDAENQPTSTYALRRIVFATTP